MTTLIENVRENGSRENGSRENADREKTVRKILLRVCVAAFALGLAAAAVAWWVKWQRYDYEIPCDFGFTETAIVQSHYTNLTANGIINFRDLGGWRTADGARVRRNMIFRSGCLLTSSKREARLFADDVVTPCERIILDSGIAVLRDGFKIRTELDLRGSEELMGVAASVLGADIQWVNISFPAYRHIGDAEIGKRQFAKVVRFLIGGARYPVLMHCTGGDDRTGSLVFLLNGLLGVSETDLCRDWELSFIDDPTVRRDPVKARKKLRQMKGLCKYLSGYRGATMPERIEDYARSCGLTDAEIAAFREMMRERQTENTPEKQPAQ